MSSVLNNKLVLFIIAILLLANIALLAFFVWPKEPLKKDHGSRKPITEFLQNEIGFDGQQMTKFEALRQEHRKKMKPLFEDIRLAKIRFFKLLSDPGAPDSAIRQEASEIGNKQENIELQTFTNFKELRALCTDQQQHKYDSLIPGVINKMWFAPKEETHPEKKKSRGR